MDDNHNKNSKLNIGIVFGGISSEHEVSLLSATSVLKNIDSEKYNIIKIGITKEGEFFLYEGGLDDIPNGKWQEGNCTPCVISPNRCHRGLLLLGECVSIVPLDCVFPILHGKNGEDGTIQGLLALAGIPFVGCDTLSSASCMDKAVTKSLLDHAHIANTKYEALLKNKYDKQEQHYLEKIIHKIGFPCFVKPANAGSSVGITKATDIDSLKQALQIAFLHDKKAIVEETIIGKEIECAVLGNEEPIASLLGEIVPCNEFYDYDAKYLANKTVTFIPARIDNAVAQQIRLIAIQAYQTLGCSGLARVDFFLTPQNQIILNEINTIPGFTSISMYPQLFEASGLPYAKLIDRLIELAIERE